ncbi:PREDICTED: collagen alpha-2(I) chain-like [Cercocebus atys]|uniref:collagen alpha-2(I) chain-like n=1 Tax=Cercocebus atys TaxID=9531 RepID=UPI0005F3D808|nr:PREDICTED: collagen alpha-2(I) chain-like [Cercocebus atys]
MVPRIGKDQDPVIPDGRQTLDDPSALSPALTGTGLAGDPTSLGLPLAAREASPGQTSVPGPLLTRASQRPGPELGPPGGAGSEPGAQALPRPPRLSTRQPFLRRAGAGRPGRATWPFPGRRGGAGRTDGRDRPPSASRPPAGVRGPLLLARLLSPPLLRQPRAQVFPGPQLRESAFPLPGATLRVGARPRPCPRPPSAAALPGAAPQVGPRSRKGVHQTPGQGRGAGAPAPTQGRLREPGWGPQGAWGKGRRGTRGARRGAGGKHLCQSKPGPAVASSLLFFLCGWGMRALVLSKESRERPVSRAGPPALGGKDSVTSFGGSTMDKPRTGLRLAGVLKGRKVRN